MRRLPRLRLKTYPALFACIRAYLRLHPLERRADAVMRCARVFARLSGVFTAPRSMSPRMRLEKALDRVVLCALEGGVDLPPFPSHGVECLAPPVLVLARHAILTNRLVRPELTRRGWRAAFVAADPFNVAPDHRRGIEAIRSRPALTMLRTVARRLDAGYVVFVTPDSYDGAAAAQPIRLAERLRVPVAVCSSRVQGGRVTIRITRLPGRGTSEMLAGYQEFLRTEADMDRQAW